jgi:hypothetical protein
MNRRSASSYRHRTMGWKPEEDALVFTMSPRALAEKLGRTYAAVIARRSILRRPPPKIENIGWTARECKILCARYPIAHLVQHLPRFTPNQIRSKAHHMGLQRKFFGDSEVRSAAIWN